MEHDVIPLGERHQPHNFEYADEAERLAAVVTDAKWLQSLALQLDNGSYWRVTGVSPATWEQVVTAWVDIPGKPTEFPPEVHTHAIAEVVDLQDELDAKEPSLGFTPEDSANKSVNLAADAASDVKYPSAKAVFDAIATAVTGLLDFKGPTDASANPSYPAALKGDCYVVSVAGKIGGASGVNVDVGDTFFANADNAGGTQASVGTSWTVLEHNLAGALLASNNLSDIANAVTSRANLGLGNVDNTSDANKPVSTAQATADTAVQTAAATDATTKANAAQTAAIAASTPVAHIGSGGAAHADAVAGGASGFFTGAEKTKLNTITGTNTGDETLASLNSKLGINTSTVLQAGAVGNGVTVDDAAFATALASGNPVYVPKTSSFYVITTLTEANRALLYGPGTVKVAGVEIYISPFASNGSANQPVVGQRRVALAPPAYVGAGAVGTGMRYFDTVRTGGYGQYGNLLSSYRVDAAVPAGQFDVGDTSWVTMTNLTGGQGFGRWAGANTPAKNLGQTYTGGLVIGDEINVGNRWGDFGLQTDYGARATVGLQIVADVLPASDGVNVKVCTMTSGTPGVVNLTAHGFTAYMGVVFGTNGGTIPAALTAGTLYYVTASPTANTFGVSATIGGSAIAFATSSTGSPTVLPSYPGSFGAAHGPSVWGHQWWVNSLTRPNTLCAGGIDTLAWGGSLATLAPQAWAQLRGYWGIGLDFSAATFTTSQAIKLAANHAIYFGSASIAGGGTGGFAMSTANANVGALYSNNFAVANLQWLDIAGAPALGFFGTYPVTRYGGFGTPTNGAVQVSFDANTITLANLAKQVAYMTNVIKTYGLFGN